MTTIDKDRRILKKRNLEAFAKIAPDLNALLRAHRPKSMLVDGEDGELDVRLGGKPVYGGGADRFARRQVADFIAHPFHLVVPEPGPSGYDEHANAFIGKVLDRARKTGVSFLPKPASPKSFFLIVFGVGLGRHIDALLEAFAPSFVIFVEPECDFLTHSLETYPWHRLAATLGEKGGGFHFVFNAEPETVARAIREFVMDVNYLGADCTAAFTHLNPVFARRTLECFAVEAGLYLRALGFFYDETLMLRNAYGNLRSGRSRVFLRPENRSIEMPAFVVASGPSLDASLPFLKDNAERAVIVSAGTTLRPLLVNGITPDFQVETENINVYMGMASLANEFDLSPVCLVASSTVDQNITGLFEKTLYFFRPTLSPTPLFSDSERYCLRHPEPGVVNAALSLALDMGFREIYLFGVDLGTRDPGRHHAEDHYFFSDDKLERDADPRGYIIPVPGNFGGKVLTSPDFLYSLKTLERAIAESGSERRIYNCSDGAAIAGARPRPAAEVSLAAIKGGKGAQVRTLLDGFPVYTEDRVGEAWAQDSLHAAVDRLIDDLGARLDAIPTLRDKGYQRGVISPFGMVTMEKEEKASGIDKAVRILFRGTFLYMLMASDYYLARAATDDQAEALEDIVRDELAGALARLRDAAHEILGDPTKVPAPLSRDRPDAEQVIAELPITWGTVRRNDDCPCGSGRKYKHCHGALA